MGGSKKAANRATLFYIYALGGLLEEEVTKLRADYALFLQLFDKPAHHLQDLKRFARYVEIKLLIDRHNAQRSSAFTLGINQFADMLEEEVQAVFGNFSFHYNPYQLVNATVNVVKEIEDSVVAEWRSLSHHHLRTPADDDHDNDNDNYHHRLHYKDSLNWATTSNFLHLPLVEEVHSQGECGACWAFVTASAVEASVKYAALRELQRVGKRSDFNLYNALYSIPSLSAQQMLDCDHDFNSGCQGGNLFKAMDYVVDHGLVAASLYDYEGKVKQCRVKSNNTLYFIRHVLPINAFSDEAIYQALQNGPVGVGVCGTDQSFLFYAGGVYDSTTCCSTLNHALLLVGYGHDDMLGVDYWIALNSWSRYWGEQGYVKILRRGGAEVVPPEGICGLYIAPVQAGSGYVRRANGELAYTGDSSAWDEYYLFFYRAGHYLVTHSRVIILIFAGACAFLAFASLGYAFYLDYRIQQYRNRLEQRRKERRERRRDNGEVQPLLEEAGEDRSQYQPIPDAPPFPVSPHSLPIASAVCSK
eukprot:gene11161-12441_t